MVQSEKEREREREREGTQHDFGNDTTHRLLRKQELCSDLSRLANSDFLQLCCVNHMHLFAWHREVERKEQ